MSLLIGVSKELNDANGAIQENGVPGGKP